MALIIRKRKVSTIYNNKKKIYSQRAQWEKSVSKKKLGRKVWKMKEKRERENNKSGNDRMRGEEKEKVEIEKEKRESE